MKRFIAFCTLTIFSTFAGNFIYAQSGGTGSAPATVNCDTYMEDGPLSRATSFGEEQIVNGVYQGLAQQYNNLTGQMKSVVFWARVNPNAPTSSNTVRVVVYTANQGLPGPILGSQNVVVTAAASPYQVTATFSAPIAVSGSVIISIEPFSPATDNFFVQRNVPPDGQFLNLIKIKQANQWFKNLAAGDPTFDYDFMILPVKDITLTASFTSNTASNVTSFTNTSVNATSYEWDFGDGATSTATSPTHSYAASGTYNVKLRAFVNGVNTCTDSVTVPVNVVLTGIAEAGSLAPFTLDQNPVRDELVIIPRTDAEIIITDASGSHMDSSYLRAREKKKISTETWQPGVYFIHIPGYRSVKFVKVQ
jgi:PKD repeat protein